jgi:hypothetical protein
MPKAAIGGHQMSPKLKLLIAGFIGAGFALYGAYNIADENYGVATLVAICVAWIAVEWRARARPEAWILAVVLFGYVVGNRGFAQFQFSTRIPLLPAETALLFCTVGLGIRAAITKTPVIAIDGLNIAILIWITFATLRLPLDFNDFGVIALRDYALVYYAAFFFLSQFLCRDPASLRLLEGTLTAAFSTLPICVIIDKIAPEFLTHYLTWNGNPLIYYKSDLISASLACGCFWFWSRFEINGGKIWLFPSAVSLLLIGTEDSPRAAMVGAAVTTIAWLCARRYKLLGFQAAVIAIGITVSLPVETFIGRPLTETKSYEMFERVVSIVDFNASHSYQNSNSATTTDNNQFRRVWWQSVFDETVSTSPIFGLGFGYDLAARFLANYNWLSVEDEFTTRSPHSILVTNFGRLGAVGLGLFLFMWAMMARSGTKAFRAVDIDCMAWWSVVITIGVSACFGVVLEGPMGAVVFWIALGVAHYKTTVSKALNSAGYPHAGS